MSEGGVRRGQEKRRGQARNVRDGKVEGGLGEQEGQVGRGTGGGWGREEVRKEEGSGWTAGGEEGRGGKGQELRSWGGRPGGGQVSDLSKRVTGEQAGYRPRAGNHRLGLRGGWKG